MTKAYKTRGINGMNRKDDDSKEAKLQRKAARKQKRNEMNEAVNTHLKSDKKVYLVYIILRALIVICMVRQFLRGSYENVALCVLSLILLIMPSIMQVRLKVDLPRTLEIILLFFIYSAEILGEVNNYYTAVPMWDTVLHTLNGFLAAAIGFSMVMILNRSNKVIFELSPLYICIVAFCFSMTIGAVWEVFEFSMDWFFGLDMQKDTIVHSISSVAINPTGAQVPVRINGITSTMVNGQDLGINGYLDIGIIDTMKDLIVNLIGAVVFSVIGYLALKGGEREVRVIEKFIVRPVGVKKSLKDGIAEKQAADQAGDAAADQAWDHEAKQQGTLSPGSSEVEKKE